MANLQGLDNEASGYAGVAQLVERQPSKLNVAGSTPVTRFHLKPLRIPHLGDTPDRIWAAHEPVRVNNRVNTRLDGAHPCAVPRSRKMPRSI